MANPSTGFGGAGTEVLRRGYIDGMTNSEATLLTGVANHIYTVLSIIWSNKNSSDEAIHLYVDPDLGGTDLYLFHTQSVPGDATYIFNDKFVITETDKLHSAATSAADFDVWITYIDQQLA